MKCNTVTVAIIGLAVIPGFVHAQPSLTLNWARTDSTIGLNRIRYDVVVTLPNGNFVVGGLQAPTPSAADDRALIRCFTPAGNLVWERVLTGPLTGRSLRVDRMMTLFDGSILVTCVGQSGLTVRLNGITGATISSKSVPGSCSTSAIAADASTYFAGDYEQPKTGFFGSLEYNGTLRRVAVHRVTSNYALFSTDIEHSYFGDVTQQNPTTVTRHSAPRPVLRFITAPGAVYFMATSIENQSTPAFTYDYIQSDLSKFSNSGATLNWSQKLGVSYLRGSDEVLTTSVMEQSAFGRTVTGNLRINYIVRTGTVSTGFSFHDRSTEFADVDGAWSLQQDQVPLYHNLQNLNGFSYISAVGVTGMTESAAKLTNAGGFLWSGNASEVTRHPFQYSLIQKNVSNIVVERRTDSNGALIDSTTFNLATDQLHDAVENTASGDGFIVGDRILANNRRGAFVAKYSQAPLAVGNTYSTAAGTTLNAGSVLSNDRFGLGTTAAVLRSTTNGSLVFNPDGTFQYTPRAGFVGSDNFTYRIHRPGLLVFSSALVTINVMP